jgi:hypothetical protein
MTDDCACCAGLEAETPRRLHNAPGLPAIAYRVGRHGDFRASMLARLSSSDHPALAELTTRDADDFSIALCDAAATMLDVLGFYQERIANESYLRTAVERRSVLELARLIGYEPAPGVAASAWLAFTIQEAPGLPGQTQPPSAVPVGTRAQSVPGPDEQPQTFETTEAIDARAEWNAMGVRARTTWMPSRDDVDLYLDGVSTGLAPGDAILIVGQERAKDTGSERWDVRIVTAVEADTAVGHTRVRWNEGLGSHTPSVLPSQDSPRVYALRQRASLFGHNAPDPRLMSTTKGSALSSLIEGSGANRKWKDYTIAANRIDLDAAYPKITAGSWVALDASGSCSSGGPYTELYRAADASVVSRVDFGLSARITRVVPDGTENLDSKHFPLSCTAVYAQSEELTVASRPIREPAFGSVITLATLQPAIGPGRALALSGKRQRIVIADGVQGLTMTPAGGAPIPLAAGSTLALAAAPLRIVGASAFPMTPDAFGAAIGTSTTLRLTIRDRDGTVGVTDVAGSSFALRPSFDTDELLSEVVVVGGDATDVEHDRDGTTFHLAAGLQHVYERQSLRVNANVARATHGETVPETLGSGAARQSDQRFTLRQPPLTYVSAATPSGRASTLAVRVNELLWHEVRSLYGFGPRDRVFTTLRDDRGATTVVFGDGVEGARLPSGTDNVRALYRKGIGVAGNLDIGRLGTLVTRPLGVTGVTNPEPARGGQDAEEQQATSGNAPLSVLTLGRAVSVQDYEDFSRTFAGIAKAHAAWIPAGPGRGVLVSVAGEKGGAIDSSDATYGSLLGALRQFGDATLSLRLESYRPATFRLRVSIKVDPDADPAIVVARSRDALRAAFSFGARGFGQMVSVDEVDLVLHRVPGLVAVNVIELYRPDQGATPRLEPRVFARLPETSLTALPLAAELLVLDVYTLAVEVMP